MDSNCNFIEQTGLLRSAVEIDNVMSLATTNDVKTFDFSAEIRAFQARVETDDMFFNQFIFSIKINI